MTQPISFGSDNHSGVHPAVMAAIANANTGHVVAYGADPWTAKLQRVVQEQFGDQAVLYPVFNGTGANVLAVRAATRPFHFVLCSQVSHLHTDECGAPEFGAGVKLKPIPTGDGKLTVSAIEAALHGRGDEHHNQPRLVSLTQSTELGTVYRPEELSAITAFCHDRGLLVHMDGARLANAAAFLDLPLRALTTDVGIDIVSFGGTKNGLLQGESVLVLNPELDGEMKFLRKQSMQLASKMRYLSVQFLTYFEHDLWLENARHANRMARLLADLVRDVPGLTITQPVEANGVFPRIPKPAIPDLMRDFFFYVWDEDTGVVRWMTSYDTPEVEVRRFAKAVRTCCSRYAVD